MRTRKRVLYPNQYILLVGPPGVGKTDALIPITRFLRKLPEIHVAPTSVTRASLTDALKDAERTIVRPGDLRPVISFNSLFVCAEELGNFITMYDGEFMSALNFFYDCRPYEERKRHMKRGESVVIDHPLLNMVMGTTPGWLISTLPANAWQEGFSSRILLVYSNDVSTVDFFEEESPEDSALEELLHLDLMDISSMYGLMRPETSVVDALRKWRNSGGKPTPTHPKLAHYLPRRPIHLMKAAMCLSASRASDYIVRLEDFEKALSMLIEVEKQIPLAFREMQTGGDGGILDEAYHEVVRLFIRFQKPVPEYKISHFVAQRAPSYTVKKIVELLYETNMLKIVDAVGPGGRPTYAPTSPENHNETMSKDIPGL